MLKFNSTIIESIYHTLINPGRHIPIDITKLTGITNEMIIGYPLFGGIKEEFIQFTQGYNLFAYNAPFEAKFLSSLLGKNIEANDVLVAVKKNIKLDKYKLSDVANHFGFKMRDIKIAHSSIEDALVCYRIILALVNMGYQWGFI